MNFSNAKTFKGYFLNANHFSKKDGSQEYYIANCLLVDDKSYSIISLNNKDFYDFAQDYKELTPVTITAVKTYNVDKKVKYLIQSIDF